jgi:heme-degrading monooxygenase HmoA
MIARVARFDPMSAEVEAAMLDNVRVRFRAAVQAQPGFEGAYWGRAEDGGWVSISLWASQEAVNRGGLAANAVPLLSHQRSELIPSPASVDTYEIVERG